jgi:hypothetical protein
MFQALSRKERVLQLCERDLIQRMQARVKPENLRDIVVSADNLAIPFFRQMGFQKHFPAETPRTFFAEIVCADDNSTLMTMALNPEIDYAGLDDWVECMASFLQSFRRALK